MNVLPVIFTLLLVIGAMSLANLRSVFSCSKKYDAYKAYLVGQRTIYNARQESFPILGKKRKEKEEDKKDGVYFRVKRQGSPLGRLNLFPLLQKEEKDHPMYPIVLRYLEELYKEILPKKEKERKNCIEKVVTKLLVEQKKHFALDKTVLSLSEIPFSKEKSLSELYYKMLRGTSPYNLEKREGYPPLMDMVTFQKEEKKMSLSFPYANPLLLTAVFGEEVTKAIIEREKKEAVAPRKRKANSALKEREVREVIKDLFSPVEEKLIKLWTYKTYPGVNPISYSDEKTCITMRYYPNEKSKSKTNLR